MKYINSRRLFWLVVIFAALFAGGASLMIGLQQSVWFDEAYSIALAGHSWGDIVRLTSADVHPPLYYWLLKAWALAFGSSELALRSLSALLFTASIGVAGLLLRRLFGMRTALTMLPFIVFAPFLLRYGFEIRMYALASLIGITATYVLVEIVETKEKRKRRRLFALYALLVAAGVYTLYFTALIWMAHFAWLALLARETQHRLLFKQAIVAYTGSFILFLPWLPVFIRGATGGSLSPVTHSLDLENSYGIITYLFLYQPPWTANMLYAAAILLTAGFLAVIGFRQANKKERRYLYLLGAYFSVPIAVLFVVTQFSPVYIERYLAHFVLGGYAVLGVLTALALRHGLRVWPAAGMLLGVLIIGCSSLYSYGNYNFQRLHTPSVEQAAALLEDCKDDAVIFADGPQIAMELDYYVNDCPVYFFNETLEMGGGFAMLSHSPLRVAAASELPETEKILHVYYDKPKNTVPAQFLKRDTIEIEAIRVTVYTADKN